MAKQFCKGKQKVVSCNLLPHCTIQFTDQGQPGQQGQGGQGENGMIYDLQWATFLQAEAWSSQ